MKQASDRREFPVVKTKISKKSTHLVIHVLVLFTMPFNIIHQKNNLPQVFYAQYNSTHMQFFSVHFDMVFMNEGNLTLNDSKYSKYHGLYILNCTPFTSFHILCSGVFILLTHLETKVHPLLLIMVQN